MDGGERARKSGWRRLLNKVKGVIRRRHEQSTADIVVVPQPTVVAEISPLPPTLEQSEAEAMPEQRHITAETATTANHETEDDIYSSVMAQPQTTAMVSTTANDVESSHDAEERDRISDSMDAEALLPMQPSRQPLTPDRARAMFERNRVRYSPIGRLTAQETLQRVQKPIRLRIHWQCHRCQTSFGASRTCSGCSHRLCSSCSKGPAKRVRETLANAAMEHCQQERKTATTQAEGVMAVDNDTTSFPSEEVRHTMVLEARSEEEMLADDDDDASDPISLLLRNQRPLSAIDLVTDSNAPRPRRTCHECHNALNNSQSSRCQNCQHNICLLCQPQRGYWGHDAAQPRQQESRMVPSVQRVYRKPRQRVRWTCHECSTLFVDKKDCRTCGHARCGECSRTPAKKVVVPPDPHVVQSVNDRLAHLTIRPSAA